MKSAPALTAGFASLLLAAAAYGQGSPPGGGGPPGGVAGCSFDAGGITGLNFGTLDPSSGTIVTATATLMVGNCGAGRTMSLSIDNGRRGNRTMIRDGGNELIAYSLSAPTFSPGTADGPGIGAYKPATFTGTVMPGAYMDAVAGVYRDLLVVTVTP